MNEVIAEDTLLATTAFADIENILQATIVRHEAELGCTIAQYYGSELVLPLASHLARSQSVQICVRANNIALSTQHLRGTSIQNQIKGRVCAIIQKAARAVVQIDCGQTLLSCISLKALKEMNLHEGDAVYCLIKAHAFVFVDDILCAPPRSGVALNRLEHVQDRTRYPLPSNGKITMSTYIKTTEDGRKVEVIEQAIYLAGKKEADRLTPVAEHPNRVAILKSVPNATHMAGRLPLTAEEVAIAAAALEKGRIAYESSPKGLAERIRKTQNEALANRDG